jgi:hypothetical protein
MIKKRKTFAKVHPVCPRGITPARLLPAGIRPCASLRVRPQASTRVLHFLLHEYGRAYNTSARVRVATDQTYEYNYLQHTSTVVYNTQAYEASYLPFAKVSIFLTISKS